MKRCFDQVDRAQWEKSADRLGYPRLAAGYSLILNALERWLLWDGDLVGDGILTLNGNAPGSAFAMWDLYVYMIESCTNYMKQWPMVQLTVHVDDFGVSCSGESPTEVAAQLSLAWAWIVDEFQNSLCLPFSLEKT